jgi:hypothetical protein
MNPLKILHEGSLDTDFLGLDEEELMIPLK